MVCNFLTGRFKHLSLVALAVVSLYTFCLPTTSPIRLWHAFFRRPRLLMPRESAANSTLGFQRILVVSNTPSWRTRGLQAAAWHTGIDLTVPPQPFTSDEMVKAFEDIGGSEVTHPAHGSARAWVAHLDMIKYVVANELETAFIMEDDVDWDTAIHEQMAAISDNVRTFSATEEDDPAPFGSSWDVLWLGHCGEVTGPDTPRLEYPDPTMMATDLYAGWSKKWLKNIRDGHRAVQIAHSPICSFGYGITCNSAQKILRLLGRGQGEAFDINLMQHCQNGNLRCIAVNPEIMHHYNPPDGTGYVSPVSEGDGEGLSAEDGMFERVKGTTPNLKHSARCEVLFHETCPQLPTSIQ